MAHGTTTANPLHVLVIGGGIGGLCLAHGLRRAGLSVAVYERDTSAADWPTGYRIHINATGSRALHACLPPHLWQRFVASAARPGDGIGFMTEQLRELMLLRFPNVDPSQGEHPIDRGVLREILLAELDDVVSFGKRVVEYRQDDHQVIAIFADGSSASGDVLVGADGAASQVRRQLLPHARIVDTAAVGLGARLPLDADTMARLPRALTSRMNSVMPPSHSFMFTAPFIRSTPEQDPASARLPNHVFWALIVPRAKHPDVLRLDPESLRDRALRVVDNWHPQLRGMVADADPASMVAIALQTSLPVDTWPTSRVTVLGDAIHTMTPLQGLGANTALKDAQRLTHALVEVERGRQALLPALASYELAMREYGFAAVRRSLWVTRSAISASRFGRDVFKTVLRAVDGVPALKERMFATGARD